MQLEIDDIALGELQLLEEFAREHQVTLLVDQAAGPDGQARLVIKARRRSTLERLSKRIEAMRVERAHLAASFALPAHVRQGSHAVLRVAFEAVRRDGLPRHGGRDFFLSAVQRRLDAQWQDLRSDGITSRETYVQKCDPRDNEHRAALEPLPLAPVYDLLDGLGLFYYEERPSDGQGDRLNRSLYAAVFGLSPATVDEFFAIVARHGDDPFACRERLNAFLERL